MQEKNITFTYDQEDLLLSMTLIDCLGTENVYKAFGAIAGNVNTVVVADNYNNVVVFQTFGPNEQAFEIARNLLAKLI